MAACSSFDKNTNKKVLIIFNLAIMKRNLIYNKKLMALDSSIK
jgi:hypothetical protein